MKLNRALGLSAVAASLVLSGCTTATDGRAQDDSISTNAAGTCPSGYVLTKIGKCAPVDETQPTPTTTSPTAAPNADPIPASEPDVSACDGTKCSFGAGDDEVDGLVSESLDDVTVMWANLNVHYTLHMYKGGIGECRGNSPTATAWTCVYTNRGGWDAADIRARAAKYGATLSDTVRSIIAHEVGHIVLYGWDGEHADGKITELRADCLAAGYSRWTMTTSDSSMGQLPMETMQNVLHGSQRAAAIAAGYNGTPKTCVEYTP